MQLIIDTQGTYLKKRNNCFQIKNEKQQRIIAPNRISSIAITNQCMISSAAVELAINCKIPIFFLDATGNVIGKLWSSELSHFNQLRRFQVLALESIDFRIAEIRSIFSYKTDCQIRVLKQLAKNHGKKEEIEKAIDHIIPLSNETIGQGRLNFEEIRSKLMGYEGSVAKIYWRQINSFLEPKWQFHERSRRPAKDPFNAILNYSYGMLYHVVEQAIFASGLDPTFGFMHRDQSDQPSLSFDLIEPFRPWIDYCVIENILQEELVIDYCHQDPEKGWIIEKNAKRKIVQIVNEELNREREMEDRIMKFRNHIYRYSEIYAERIRMFITKTK